MPESYPSRTITILDLPEVKRFSAKFSYNFFTADEKVNDKGNHIAPHYGNLDSGAASDDHIKTQLSKRFPRFARFDFTPVAIRGETSLGQNDFVALGRRAMISQGIRGVSDLITANLEKIKSEIEVSTKAYTAINLQDGDISRKINNIMDLSVDIRAETEGSPMDRVKVLNDLTSSKVVGGWLIRLMGGLRDSGVSFISVKNKRVIEKNKFRRLARVNTYGQINDKFAAAILR